MRRITIKIPQNRFGIRSTSTSAFTQQSGKPSLILCKRIKWRLSDGLCLPQVEASSWTREARSGVHLQMRPAKPHGIKGLQCTCTRTLSLSLSHFSLWRRYCLPEAPIYILLGALGKARTCCFLSAWFV